MKTSAWTSNKLFCMAMTVAVYSNAIFIMFFAYPSNCLTLTPGQRIPSRKPRTSKLKSKSNLPTTTLLKDDNLATLTPNIQEGGVQEKSQKNAKSLFDLPAVENWGMQNGLKEHHLKTLYRIVMNTNAPPLHSHLHSSSSSSLGFAPPEDIPQGLQQQNQNPNRNLDINLDFIPLEERLLKADFPKKQMANLLSEFAYTCSVVRVEESKSESNGGYKFVIQLGSGKLVETVLIQHERNNGDVRYTVCVSSQVGCAKKCSFCATGTMGLQAQLTSGEILEQVFLAKQYLASLPSSTRTRSSSSSKNHHQIRNVVFMGMGEPLDNYEEVHEALRGLTHQCLFGFKAKHVTLSTVGASAAKIRILADEAPQISLALSLHSAIQESREKLIPSASANPIPSLGDALDYHSAMSGRGAMLEYLLIDGVNDSDAEVEALANFCKQRNENANTNAAAAGGRGGGQVFVNLIPYNPTLAGDDFGYETPSDERVNAFHDRLKDLGVKSLVRWSSATGRDANGACGQLVLNESMK